MIKVSFSADDRHEHHSGINPAAGGFLLSRHLKQSPARLMLLLARDIASAEKWASDFMFFMKESGVACRVLMYPEVSVDDAGQANVSERHLDRMAVLDALCGLGDNDELLVLATTVPALFEPVPKRDAFSKRCLLLKEGEERSPSALVSELVELGYGSEALCEAPGDFAQRGGLVDVFPVNADEPLRIDFFGDEIDAIRVFDPSDQRSVERVPECSIAPAEAFLDSAVSGGLDTYLPDRVIWSFLEPEAIEDHCGDFFQSPEKIKDTGAHLGGLLKYRKGKDDQWLAFSQLPRETSLFAGADKEWKSEALSAYRSFVHGDRLGLERLESEKAARSDFLIRLGSWAKEGFAIYVITANEGEAQRLREVLEAEGPEGLKPTYLQGSLSEGFYIDDDERAVYVTRSEILGTPRKTIAHLRKRKGASRSRVDEMLNFAELANGDHLVHLQHGICIYRGLHEMDFGNCKKEVVSLEFQDDSMIHLPLHESHLLSRYVGLSKARPKLGKIGGTAWQKARSAAERATLDFAAELLSLQAKRESETGHAYESDTEWQMEFEASFEHKETADQLTAIEEAKEDMEKTRPMDRLLCGDVGFGKTEVALRAAFKAVMGGKQVALLSPTTVLTQQHFNTFRERMADYPVVVEMLSRFRKPREVKKVQEELKSGGIDIVVGTHKLLGKNVQFKDLGLLIVDEEHRFGVRHKERIKQMRSHVDILSMSATPIPRTLYLALVGARNLSVIETAPRDRLPIETVVKNYDPEVVKGAVLREVERGGQVFYLHNRVQTIETVARKLEEQMPHLSVGVGHGQMEEGELEKIMTDFVAGRYDVLVCTTIIESGLDIPNCNTIIIESADRFGLSQLYQLRGRVGRFKRQAYAYLLLHRHGRMPGEAGKRLNTLRQHNQLGAGFRIAMRDLELRGAGHLLGEKQSGHIAGIGFDLYCQLLRHSIARLKGENVASNVRAALVLDFVRMGDDDGEVLEESSGLGFEVIKHEERKVGACPLIKAYIPSSYLPEPQLRIEFYRRLSMAATAEDVDAVAIALEDRFGKLTLEIRALVDCSRIRAIAEEKGISRVETEGNRLKCRLAVSGQEAYIKLGPRFPRLTAKKPALRLKEIIDFLKRQQSITQ